MVLDFANKTDDINKSFDPYYEKTFISECTDKDVSYQLTEDLQDLIY